MTWCSTRRCARSARLAGLATVADETTGWTYHHHLDLTGFVDGTENPPMAAAAEYALVGSGPGAGGSVLLLQRWDHDALAWERLGDAGQEQVMGRTKATDEELEDKSPTSHIARNDQDEVGQILRRNIAVRRPPRARHALRRALRHPGDPARDAPADGRRRRRGRDDLTRFTTPVTGAYYFLPAATDLPAPPGRLTAAFRRGQSRSQGASSPILA